MDVKPQEPEPPDRFRPMHYAFAIVIVALCTVIGLPFRGSTDPDNLTMVYLTGVVITAVRLGMGPSLLASLLSVACFNFFFVTPYYSFAAMNSGYYFTFLVMLVTSLLAGSSTARLLVQSERARKSEADMRILYDLNRALASTRSLSDVADEVATHFAKAYKVRTVIWLFRDGGFDLHPPGEDGDLLEQSAVLMAVEKADLAGRQTLKMPSARGFYIPLLSETIVLGALGFYPQSESQHFDATQILQFETCATLAAAAIQRLAQAQDTARLKAESENERLRNLLLASISHDLRTPLTVMNGGLSALLRMRKRLPREAVDEVTALWTQLTDLQKFVGNLLKMAAITSGQLKLNLEPYLIQEIIGAAIQRVSEVKAERKIITSVSGQLPLLQLDGSLMEQVIINLLENAIAHTKPDGVLSVSAESTGREVRIRITDNGVGFEPGQEHTVFERRPVSSAARQDRKGSESTGLGLAICKAIVQSHGGTIAAENHLDPDGEPDGACFTIVLPVPKSE